MTKDLQESFTNEIFDLSRSFPLIVRREIDELTQNPNRRQSFNNYTTRDSAAIIIWATYMTCNEIGEEDWASLLPSVGEATPDIIERIQANLVRLVTTPRGNTCYLDYIVKSLQISAISVDYLSLLEEKRSFTHYSTENMITQAADFTLKNLNLNTSYIKSKIIHKNFRNIPSSLGFDHFSIFSRSVMNKSLSTEVLEEILNEVLLVDDHEAKMEQVCQIAMNERSPAKAYELISDAAYWKFNAYKAVKNPNFPFNYIVKALNHKASSAYFKINLIAKAPDEHLNKRLDFELLKTGMMKEEIEALPWDFKNHIFGISL